MSKLENSIVSEDILLKAIGKSEVLIEEHEEALNDLEDNSDEIEGWITLIFKAIKSALLN